MLKKILQVVSRREEGVVSKTAWDEFIDWCLRKDLKPIPAHAWTLAYYVLTLEGLLSLTQIRKCLAETAKAHAEKFKTAQIREPSIEKPQRRAMCRSPKLVMKWSLN